jgi:hypothetical protein
MPTPLKLQSFNTRLRKSYIDKTTRTGEQVIKPFQANNKTRKGPGVFDLIKGFLDLPAIRSGSTNQPLRLRREFHRESRKRNHQCINLYMGAS